MRIQEGQTNEIEVLVLKDGVSFTGDVIFFVYNEEQEEILRQELYAEDGEIHEVKTLAMGLSIYPTGIIQKLDYPYCKTTDALSQDSYLSQKIRDVGYKCLVDTNIKIGHQDRDGFIYY